MKTNDYRKRKSKMLKKVQAKQLEALSIETVRVRGLPTLWATPLNCRNNVLRQVELNGGSAVYGWQIETQPIYYTRINHCVWQDAQGKQWDITPKVYRGKDGRALTRGEMIGVYFPDIEF